MIPPAIQNKMTIVEGDTTGLDVDAIVNAAGQGLLKECWALGGCPTGEARINAGHNLSAR
jgi:O-acetyl-ADP-ribose deacetylase (regulator of RNase III)